MSLEDTFRKTLSVEVLDVGPLSRELEALVQSMGNNQYPAPTNPVEIKLHLAFDETFGRVVTLNVELRHLPDMVQLTQELNP